MQYVAVVISWLAHTRPGHALKQPLNLLSTMSEVICPEVVAWVLDQLDESYQQPPRVWPIDNEALQQDTCDLLLNDFLQCAASQTSAKHLCMILPRTI